jgi:hypothetical protein
MRILALDLGRRNGVAAGECEFLRKRAPPPCVEALELRGASPEGRVQALAIWLAVRLHAPPRYDLIVTEAPLNPAASKSDKATIDLLGYYFCLQTVAVLFEIRVEAVPVMAARKHFTGIACSPPVRGRKRSSREAAAARTFINETVLKRAIALGYLPDGSKDWDKANACCLFDFAAAKFARTVPGELAMYGISP